MKVYVFAFLSVMLCAAIARAQSVFWNADATFAPVFDSPTLPLEGRVYDMARQPDGKVLVSGYIERVNGVVRSDPTAMLRFNHDGTVDASFNAMGGAGLFWLQPSGKIVTAGGLRLQADGSHDATFNADRILTRVLHVDDTGRVYAASADNVIVRSTSEGIEDGVFRYNPDRIVRGLTGFSDGAAVVALEGQSSMIEFVRLNSDGSVDPDFESDWNPATFLGMVGLPDGKLLVYGFTSSRNGIALQFGRLTRKGVADYRYDAPGGNSSSLQAADTFVLAGVLYDLLREGAASAPIRAHLGRSFDTFQGGLDVAVDGTAYIATSGWSYPSTFARYVPAGSGPLTIDPRPTIRLQNPTSPQTRLMNEPFFLMVTGGGLHPITYQWFRDGTPIEGATRQSFRNDPVQTAPAAVYTVAVSNAYGSVTAEPVVVTLNTTPAPIELVVPLSSRTVSLGDSLWLSVEATANPFPSFAWTLNGRPITSSGLGSSGGRASSSLDLEGVQPGDAGIYRVVVSSGASSLETTAVLGVQTTEKASGAATEIAADIVHPNKNIYDQVLLGGSAAAITADPGQVTRMSFVDLTNDIVQVEMSGAGTLALVLDNAAAPAAPASYNQPGVAYVQGHPGIVVTGADETTHVSVFTVGRANAVNQTLFRDNVDYDGIADVAFIAIQSIDGRFGSLRTANVEYYANRGLTGVYAPGVTFTGPVYIGDIDAFDSAQPVLLYQGAQETRVAGGDLAQTNGARVQISAEVSLNFTAGSTSHGDPVPVQPNRGTFEQYGSR